jgi:hypothetical protein
MIIFDHDEDWLNGNEHYIIIPLNQLEYNGVLFDSDSKLMINGFTIGGRISKGFRISARLMKKSVETAEYVTIDIPDHHYVYVGHDGDHIGTTLNGLVYVFKECHINSNNQGRDIVSLFDGGTYTTYKSTERDPL